MYFNYIVYMQVENLEKYGERKVFKKRDAVDTITGYFYQFDYYINMILEQRSSIDYLMKYL